jgi:linalool 8-monooxygenase
LRRAVAEAFTPEKVAALEPRIRAHVARLIDAIAPVGSADFVTAIAAPTTLGVLTSLFDLPQSDFLLLLNWSNALIGEDDPDYQPPNDDRIALIDEIDAYAYRLFADRHDRTSQDIASLLVNAKVDGRPMTFSEFSVNFGAFVIAGNETTRHAIAHGMLALSLFPDQKSLLLDDPALIEPAAKEIIRWATPLLHVRRTAMRDVELGGKMIKAGDKVVVWYHSANRDEEKWSNPRTFDVQRFAGPDAPPHLSFGAGPHHCLGWRLAELQVRVVFEEVLRRMPDIRAIEPIRRVRSNFISGIKTLPVVFTRSCPLPQ